MPPSSGFFLNLTPPPSSAAELSYTGGACRGARDRGASDAAAAAAVVAACRVRSLRRARTVVHEEADVPEAAAALLVAREVLEALLRLGE